MLCTLGGIHVVELGQVYAAPYAGSIFADLGASVTKVERPGGGDDARRMGRPFRNGDAFVFQVFNHGKASVTLDLNDAQDKSEFERLIAQADIFIHNLRPGSVEKLGIGGETLVRRHPKLIYCEISAFGHDGPMSMLPGYEPLIQAFSGLSSTNGGPDDPPMRAAPSLCDQGSGMWVVIGALAMLHRRQRTGHGGVLRTSLLETALSWNAQKSDALINEGHQPSRHRTGHPGFVPYQAFDTKDSPMLICCGNDRLFAKLASELGRADWGSDARFATNRARLANKDALLRQLEPILRQHDRQDWLRRFELAGIPCAPIHTLSEALQHPQVQALGQLAAVPGSDILLTAMPLTIDGVRQTPGSPAPPYRNGDEHAR
ncbi:CaiB/BaiF CoA transferase family protein [Castellaniella sp. WN]